MNRLELALPFPVVVFIRINEPCCSELVFVVGRICSTQPFAGRMWPSKGHGLALLNVYSLTHSCTHTRTHTHTHTHTPATLQAEGAEIPFYLSIYLFKCLYRCIFLVYCLLQTLVSQSPRPAVSQECVCLRAHNVCTFQ